jgi:DNA-binding HxlR family transcriptional regulator
LVRVIAMRMGADALAYVRFGISPLVETLRSVRVLADPASQALHLPWVAKARARTEDLDLAVLLALQPGDAYSPDFVHPPPTSPLAEFEQELGRMAATPPAQVRREVERAYAGRSMPSALKAVVASPGPAVRRLAELLAEYWRRVLEPDWPRIRAVLEGDVLYRARRMADGGAQGLFGDLQPTVASSDGVLRIAKRADGALDLDERGLLLVPSVFVGPAVSALMDPAWQPALVYPARGAGMLWEPAAPATTEALAALIGRRRGAILTALDQPRSTAELGRRLGLSGSSVSQHLGVLERAGLIHRHRVGRVVLYMRTPAGEAVVSAE